KINASNQRAKVFRKIPKTVSQQTEGKAYLISYQPQTRLHTLKTRVIVATAEMTVMWNFFFV
ncbi:MAG: hypothetical protein ABI575_08880, partial [Oxalobacteraceae bacterium]